MKIIVFIGETQVQLKGCFNNQDCNQTECITSELKTNDIFFCCCMGSMCNTEYRWIPVVHEATTQGTYTHKYNYDKPFYQ